jgi:hypothetical protein
MLFGKPLPFVVKYVEMLNDTMKEHMPGFVLSNIQSARLSFYIMGILVTNSICWAIIRRSSVENYNSAALSWIFRKAKIRWEVLPHMSTKAILHQYGIKKACIAIDDSEKKRSKSTKNIAYVHKTKDKSSGGFIMGQSLVFIVLVTPQITIPVGFAFYMPDPELSVWYKQNEKLKKQGIPPKERPPKPVRNKNYPTKQEIALKLLEEFKRYHPDITIKCVLADALYGTQEFLDKASRTFGGVQVISQLRINQNIRFRGKEYSVEEYFSKYPGVPQTMTIRGDKEKSAIVGSARLHVSAHGKKRFVIALKYEGEEEYRYLVASDLTWRTMDITQAYTLRWLVEVFFQDWKSHEGWATLAKQPGEEGSSRSLILSLLVDHCLLLHPEQSARLENKLPAYTVGSLRNQVKVESLLAVIRDLLSSDDPKAKLQLLSSTLQEHLLKPSKKHMAGRDLGRLEPTPSLKYKAA